MKHNPFILPPEQKISLRKDYAPTYKDDYHQKSDGVEKLQADINKWILPGKTVQSST